MKKIALYFTVLSALILACGCVHTAGKGQAASPVSTLDRISQRNLLVVGTAGSMPPLNMTTTDGDIIGLEPDLAERMAAEMGVKVEFKTMPFADLLPALEAGEVDMVLSDVTITGRRNMKVAFVGPYFISGKTFLTTETWAASAKKPEEVNSPDTRLTALNASTSQEFVEETFPQATLLLADDYDAAVKMVLEGEADAMIADYPICLLSVIRYPEANLFSVVPPYTYEPIGIAIQKNDPLLANWLENFLTTLSGSGELKGLKEKWFEGGTWIKRLP
ncbi:MAG: transporter substrate-binding domain-containing protein [Deltaproteobacteria bacterium]|nr:transporter substrate-binding domain-containing protein [Deltaproteobacteria bacterium]MCF8119139.1 transporter substrate-binding domain-containing protein [Deltaproteobacteria bacterium]